MPRATATGELRAHMAELDLAYSDRQLRRLVRRHGLSGAKAYLEEVAALVVYAELVWPEVAITERERYAVPGGLSQDEAAALLREHDFEGAKRVVLRRAELAATRLRDALETVTDEEWAELYRTDARRRHAALTGTFEAIGGTLGHRLSAVLGFMADAGLERDGARAEVESLVRAELDRAFPHAVDEDARRLLLRRRPDLSQQTDYFADQRRFRERVEDVIASCCEQLADRVEEGWHPDAARVAAVDRSVAQRVRAWLSTNSRRL